jgi:GTP diphosphokinase / guanosine-3',5'-bis(diphosphate) 3'-diphosphatase
MEDKTDTKQENKPHSKVVVDTITSRTRVASPDYDFQSTYNVDVAPPEQIFDPESRFKKLLSCTPYLSNTDKQKLKKAYLYAKKQHKDVKRKSGEPYIIHPIEVAIILSDFGMDVDTLCAALLHDTVEDTDTTTKYIKQEFNIDVALMVEGVTKITKIQVDSLTESQALTLRKMFVAVSNDIRTIVIKLADRLHNMRTLYALREDRRIFKSKETLEIFAPIAHRLGIDSMKWELEDLSFYYIEPKKYYQIAKMVTDTRKTREEYLSLVIDKIKTEMEKLNVNCKIMGRPKHLYSIYCKMKNKDKDFSEIYDLIAARIIVDDIKDCYTALGAVHNIWSPIPNRFKDYIAMPKHNMYQSLHTSVIGPAGHPLEVQIRTEEMHKKSEYGVAAHWRYKEKSKSKDKDLEQQLAWMREMVNWQDETNDSKEMLKALKTDLVQNEVFVFTPNGEAKSLRLGSTPVDFAYSIHTEVGFHCVGAKVNGQIVPLTYKLKTGDRVEILMQKSSTPSRDWLNFVKTPSARAKIRSYFSKITKEDDLQKGHDMLVSEMRKNGVGLTSAQANRSIAELACNMKLNSKDELLIKIGSGKESVKSIASKLLKMMVDNGQDDKSQDLLNNIKMATGKMPKMLTNSRHLLKKSAHTSNGIVVKGIDDVLVRLSKCCNPVPGDDIIGFITRGRGVSVHRSNCPNAQDLKKNPERLIHVEWDTEPSSDVVYTVEIGVDAIDRLGLVGDVSNKLSEMGVNFLNFSACTKKNDISTIKFTMQVAELSLIDKILESLVDIEGVIDVYRVNN